MLLIDGVRGVLTQAGVGEDTIQEILTMLSAAQTDVEQGRKIELAPAGAYGGSATAAVLSTHAGKAHHHVLAAMTEMVGGLEGYYKSVEYFREDVHETDANEGRAYTRRTQRAEQVDISLSLAEACTQQPDFHENPTCEVPTEEGEQ